MAHSTNNVVKFGPRLAIYQSFKFIEKASHDKEEVFDGSVRMSGDTTPSTFTSLS